MVVPNPAGNSPTIPDQTAASRTPVPVFVDATGRRARLMRWCGLLLAAGSLVYVPIVGIAVLTGPSVPRVAPLPGDETGMEIGDQPPEQGGPLVPHVVAADDELAGAAPTPPNKTRPRPSLMPEPEPRPDEQVPALPPSRSDEEPSPPPPSTAAPTPPSPSGATPSPSTQVPSPQLPPTAPGLLYAAGRGR
ncbi:hypothetical protein [Micromonospora avicenniae]|uniref:hypothetical protein n=1 Tax=Micromonospora avicenniae TaxID=1198245 RepID=UPI0011154C2D|nr:hypothetical protein [Micromonospora avicenniae]